MKNYWAVYSGVETRGFMPKHKTTCFFPGVHRPETRGFMPKHKIQYLRMKKCPIFDRLCIKLGVLQQIALILLLSTGIARNEELLTFSLDVTLSKMLPSTRFAVARRPQWKKDARSLHAVW